MDIFLLYCCMVEHIGSCFSVFLQHLLHAFEGFRALGCIMPHHPTMEALNVVVGTAAATSPTIVAATTTPAPLAQCCIGMCGVSLIVVGILCTNILFFVCFDCVHVKGDSIVPCHSNEKSWIILPF